MDTINHDYIGVIVTIMPVDIVKKCKASWELAVIYILVSNKTRMNVNVNIICILLNAWGDAGSLISPGCKSYLCVMRYCLVPSETGLWACTMHSVEAEVEFCTYLYCSSSVSDSLKILMDKVWSCIIFKSIAVVLCSRFGDKQKCSLEECIRMEYSIHKYVVINVITYQPLCI